MTSSLKNLLKYSTEIVKYSVNNYNVVLKITRQFTVRFP